MRVLTIGNSFSDDTMQYVYDIAKSIGGTDNLYLGNLVYGGCSLIEHLNFYKEKSAVYEYRTNDGNGWQTKLEATSFDALLDGEWDVISFQQASGFSGKQESYEVLPELMSLVRKVVGEKPKFVWNMTWAYSSTSDHPHFEWYEKDQLKMYGAICSAVKNKVLTVEEITAVSPCGMAVQNARQTGLNGVGYELTRDGFHLDFGAGRLVAGLTFTKAILGLDIEKCTFKPDGVTDEMLENAIESALKAVENSIAK